MIRGCGAGRRSAALLWCCVAAALALLHGCESSNEHPISSKPDSACLHSIHQRIVRDLSVGTPIEEVVKYLSVHKVAHTIYSPNNQPISLDEAKNTDGSMVLISILNNIFDTIYTRSEILELRFNGRHMLQKVECARFGTLL
jgi:hypothetical protein